MKKYLFAIITSLAFIAVAYRAASQGTAFTYQGRLNSSGSLADGSYDFQFSIFKTPTGGVAAAGPLTSTATGVTNGLFTVLMDFGSFVFDGTSNWLQISVQTNGGSGFIPLTPRQLLAPTPYAVFANTASNLAGTISSANLSGTYGNAIILSNVANQISGNGSNLTSLNATNLNGKIPTTAIPANVALLTNSQTFNGANTFQVLDTAHGLRVTDGSTNSNVTIQPLAGANSGFEAISFNGYFDNAEARYNSNKVRWRMFADQRGSTDIFHLDIYNGLALLNALTLTTNGNFTVSGTNTASVFSGSGQGLTGVGLLNGNQTFTGVNNFNQNLTGSSKLILRGSYPAVGSSEDLRIVRGTVNYAGTLENGAGFSISHPGTGDYVITYTQPFTLFPSVTVTPAPVGGGSDVVSAQIVLNNNTSFEVNIYDVTAFDSLRDVSFNFISIGSF